MAKKYCILNTPKRVFRFSNKNKKLQLDKILPNFEFIQSSNSHNCQSIQSQRAYKFYKIKSKQKSKLSEVTFNKICELFLKELRLQMLNNERGVFIENFGYFGIIKAPTKTINNLTPVPTKDINTMGDRYRPIFLPIRKDGHLNGFIMDKAFLPSFYSGITSRLGKDRKYKFSFTLLHNLYGRENNKINSLIEK
jgi:hypothetical protein